MKIRPISLVLSFFFLLRCYNLNDTRLKQMPRSIFYRRHFEREIIWGRPCRARWRNWTMNTRRHVNAPEGRCRPELNTLFWVDFRLFLHFSASVWFACNLVTEQNVRKICEIWYWFIQNYWRIKWTEIANKSTGNAWIQQKKKSWQTTRIHESKLCKVTFRLMSAF